jgi:DNA-binding MarR family transcriptional regulator
MDATSRQPPDDAPIDMGSLTQSLGFLIRLAQVRLYDLFFAGFDGVDVKPGEITVLWVLDLNPGARQGAVARELNIKPAHMTKLVQRLVHDGLIARQVPPEDRRSVLLSLTEQGKQRLETLRPAFLAIQTAESTGLSPRETDQLRSLIHKLAFPKDRP